MMRKRQIACFLWAMLLAVVLGSCSDNITHVYDCEIGQNSSGGDAGDSENEVSTRTSPTDEDDSDESTDGSGQGIRPPGWEDFGGPCETHDDCSDIPGGGKCINSIMQLIFAPKGYCVACCNEPGIDMCGPGFDCVGVKNDALTYLVCINNCEEDKDCRQEDGYECKPVPYLEEYYPGQKYCMPIVIVPPADDVQEIDPECDWGV